MHVLRNQLLVNQYGVNNYCVLCTVKAKKANKNLNFVGFHNHSPLLTMVRQSKIYFT